MNRRSFFKNMVGCAALAVSLNLPINPFKVASYLNTNPWKEVGTIAWKGYMSGAILNSGWKTVIV